MCSTMSQSIQQNGSPRIKHFCKLYYLGSLGVKMFHKTTNNRSVVITTTQTIAIHFLHLLGLSTLLSSSTLPLIMNSRLVMTFPLCVSHCNHHCFSTTTQARQLLSDPIRPMWCSANFIRKAPALITSPSLISPVLQGREVTA